MAEASSDYIDSKRLQGFLDEELTNGLCSACGCTDETKIKLIEIDNGALLIKICTNCNHSVGLDDSIDYAELCENLVKKGIAQITITPCGNCKNGDINKFSLEGYDEFGRELVQCKLCGEFGNLNTGKIDLPDKSDDVDSLMLSKLEVNCENEEFQGDLMAVTGHSGDKDFVTSFCGRYDNCDQARSVNEAPSNELDCYLTCEKCNNSEPDQFSDIIFCDDHQFVECLRCKQLHKITKNILHFDKDFVTPLGGRYDSELKQNFGGVKELDADPCYHLDCYLQCEKCNNSAQNQFSEIIVCDDDQFVECLVCKHLYKIPKNILQLSNTASDYTDDRDLVRSLSGGYDSEQGPTLSVVEESVADPSDEPDCYLQCENCNNSEQNLFSEIIECDDDQFVECNPCKHLYKIPKNLLHISNEPETSECWKKEKSQKKTCSRSDEPGRTQVTKLNMLSPGDHIEWHRNYIFYHHAIVEDIDLRKNTLTVIEFTGAVKKMNGFFASVRRNTSEFNEATKDMMFRLNYGEGCSLSRSDTLRRARSRIGETGYSPFGNNCQHFATICKTGRAKSGQVKTLTNRLMRAAGTSGIKAVEELGIAGVMAVAKQIPWKQSCQIARGFGCKHAVSCGEGVAKFVRNLKAGSIILGIGVNLAVEGFSFAYYTHDAYCKLRDKKISREDFERQRMKFGIESIGGFVGCTIGGILGQFIPFPIVGALIGCTIGSIVGRLFGAWLGKLMSESLVKTM